MLTERRMLLETLNEVYNDLLALDVTFFAAGYRLSGDCDAVTIKLGRNFGVFLDIDRIRTIRQEKEAVIHEWAHIVTDATYGVDAPVAIRQKAEETARRAEIKKLLPFEKMRGVIQAGYTQIYELSEFFNVSEEMVLEAIDYYTGPCGLTFD